MIDSFMRTHEGTDWRHVLLNALNDDYTRSGNASKLNHCKYGNCGDLTRMPAKERDKVLENALLKAPVGQGYIYKVRQLGYMVCKTRIEYCSNIPGQADWWMACGRGAEAVLISEHSGQWQMVSCGSEAQMKGEAKKLLRRLGYSFDCYIITKNTKYRCFGDIKKYKTTTQETDKEKLVIPYYEYKILGRVNM